MNKELEQLKKQLVDMQERIAYLEQKEKETQDVFPSMLPPLQEDRHGYFLHSANFTVEDCVSSKDKDQNFFPTEDVAKAYADAFKVIIELRRCPFSGETYGEGDRHYGWWWDCTGDGYRVDCVGGTPPQGTPEYFSIVPPFSSMEHCKKAVEGVGKERIKNAVYLLAGR